MKKWIVPLLTAALTLAMLTGCGEAASSEVDTRQYAQPVSAAVTLPEGMDSTARFAQQYVDGGMVVVFNGIQNRDTTYFRVPGGELTFTMQATGESSSIKYTKVAVWTKVEGGTEYVEGTTVYFTLGEKATEYVISGLDPELSYRLTVSYDSASYYTSGTLMVAGAVDPATIPEA